MAFPNFPRLANVYLTDITNPPSLGKWDLLVTYGGTPYTNQYSVIRAANPLIKILQYLIADESTPNINRPRPQSPTNGFITAMALSQSDSTSILDGAKPIYNVSDLCPINGAGQTWNNIVAAWIAANFVAPNLSDGLLLDHTLPTISQQSPSDIDLNNNATNDYTEFGSTAAVDAHWATGLVDLATQIRLALGHSLLFVGLGSLDLSSFSNGRMNQGFLDNIGGSNSWLTNYNDYVYWQSHHYGTGYYILAKAGTQTNYQRMRYFLGTCLLGDGYFAYDAGASSHNSDWWYDEYSVDITTGIPTGDASLKGYLGQPTGAAVLLANGLYQRNFDNGIVLVNPTGGSVTQALSPSYMLINGTQDPTANSGATISSLTLASSDARILLNVPVVIRGGPGPSTGGGPTPGAFVTSSINFSILGNTSVKGTVSNKDMVTYWNANARNSQDCFRDLKGSWQEILNARGALKCIVYYTGDNGTAVGTVADAHGIPWVMFNHEGEPSSANLLARLKTEYGLVKAVNSSLKFLYTPTGTKFEDFLDGKGGVPLSSFLQYCDGMFYQMESRQKTNGPRPLISSTVNDAPYYYDQFHQQAPGKVIWYQLSVNPDGPNTAPYDPNQIISDIDAVHNKIRTHYGDPPEAFMNLYNYPLPDNVQCEQYVLDWYFNGIAPPAAGSLSIDHITPTHGPMAGGTPIAIVGGGFSNPMTATIGGTDAAGSYTDTSHMSATSPTSSTSGSKTLRIKDSTGASATTTYSYDAPASPPVISIFHPGHSPAGVHQDVQVLGSNFSNPFTATFNGVPIATADLTWTSAGEVHFRTPTSLAAGTYPVVIKNNDGQPSNSVSYILDVVTQPPPVISSFSPASYPSAGGDTVTIHGSAFVAPCRVVFSNASVQIDSLSVAFDSNIQLRALTPSFPPGPADITAYNNDGQPSNVASGFSFTGTQNPRPSISNINPTTGDINSGLLLTINGSNFVNGFITVAFQNATLYSVVQANFINTGQITCNVPTYVAGPATVIVINPDRQSSLENPTFTYTTTIVLLPPTVELSPPARCWIVLSDTAGNPIALFNDWISLEIKHEINNYSTHTFTFDARDPRRSLLSENRLDYMLEVWRQIGPYRYLEYGGFHRALSIQLDSNQQYTFTSFGRSYTDLLRRRELLYPNDQYFTFKDGPGETVLKQIVNENVGPGANSPLRYQNGVTPGFSVEQDNGNGFTFTNSISQGNVLDALQKIAALTQVDFTVVRIGPAAFAFHTGAPQLGQDRSSTLVFAPELGNMVNPVHLMDWSDEVNAVTVLGPGQAGARLTETFRGFDLDASPWNTLEGTASPQILPGALGAFVYEAMQYAGNQKLTDAQPLIKFSFDPLQGDPASYGRDYFVGDIITARIADHIHKLKITGASLTIKEGKEDIKITLANLVVPVRNDLGG